MDVAHEWHLFHKRCMREGVTIPPMLGPMVDWLQVEGHRPPMIGWVLETDDRRRHAGGLAITLTERKGKVYAYRTAADDMLRQIRDMAKRLLDRPVPYRPEDCTAIVETMKLVPVWQLSVPTE